MTHWHTCNTAFLCLHRQSMVVGCTPHGPHWLNNLLERPQLVIHNSVTVCTFAGIQNLKWCLKQLLPIPAASNRSSTHQTTPCVHLSHPSFPTYPTHSAPNTGAVLQLTSSILSDSIQQSAVQHVNSGLRKMLSKAFKKKNSACTTEQGNNSPLSDVGGPRECGCCHLTPHSLFRSHDYM